MSLSYNQSILVDCSQVKAATTNKTSWINTLPDGGINLNPEDTISVYSAFINNKSSADSIEITDNEEPLFYNDNSLATNDPFGPETSIKENKVNLTFSYYKNATGANTIPLPYNFFLASLQKNGIVMRDGYENNIVDPVLSGGKKVFGNVGNGNQFWYKFLQDNQTITVSNAEVNAYTFAVVSNLGATDDKLCVRLAALPTGNPQLQSDYEPTDELDKVSVFKTYVGDLCQPLDGSRCTAYQFNPLTNKYVKFTKEVEINIEEGAYSPSNLGNIITNQITLAETETNNVLDENYNKNGFYIKSPVTELDDALYLSREKIENATTSKNEIASGNFVSVYPQQSPLINKIVGNSLIQRADNLYSFNPTMDNYYELGKSIKTKTALTVGNSSGFQYTGTRANAYDWGIMGRGSNESSLTAFNKPVNIYFRYPETLERGQELVENFGLTSGFEANDIMSFNYDVVVIGDSTVNPGSVLPNNSTLPGQHVVSSKGDTGYILTNVPYTSENLKKFKRFFDSQLAEDNITNCYNFDFKTANPPTSRSSTIRGSKDTIINSIPPRTVGNRWINIGVSNDRNTVTNNSPSKGYTPLLKPDGSIVYDNSGSSDRSPFPLRGFGSDYLGSDNRDNTSNIDYSFVQHTETAHGLPQPILGPNGISVIPSTDITNDFSHYYEISSSPDLYSLNGRFDIRSKHVDRIACPQLISIKNNYVDRDGTTKPFIHPLPENEFFENLGYGYMDMYISNGLDPNTTETNYIAFNVNTANTGGLNADVLKYVLDIDYSSNKVVYNSQAIGWLPFFSSHGNQAIQSVTGQGTSIEKTADIDDTDGDVDTSKYRSSITQTGIGVASNIPQVVFDDTVSRFSLQNFYTPVISSNTYSFTGIDSGGNTVQGNPNAGNEIISYNRNNIFNYRVTTGYKRFNGSNEVTNFVIYNAFNEVFPYNFLERIGQFDGEGKLSIYYQQTGVYFDKWVEVSSITGIDTKITNIEENETNFNNSFWAKKLGFTFDQTHNPVFTTPRNTKKDIFFPINNFRNSATINQNGAVDNQKYYSIPVTNNSDLYNTQFDALLYVNNKNFNQFLNNPANSVNSLEIISKTTEFLAANLPDRSSDPFFIIESSILSSGGISQNYFSQDSLLNAVDIVQKSFNSNDFYMFNGGVTHTVSNPYQLNFVEHRIRRSNGNLLKTNKFSSIIYLITKRIIIGMTPEEIQEKQEIIEQNNKEKNDKQKLLAKLNEGKNLNNKQKLLKTILFQNILNREQFDIPQDNQDNTLEDIEVKDQEEEEQDEEIPELEGDNEPINNTEQPVRELTVTLGRLIGGGILPDDEEEVIKQPTMIDKLFDTDDKDIPDINLGKVREKMIMDEEIDKTKPLFKSKGMSVKKLKKNIRTDNMEKSVLLPEKLRAKNLFKDNPDTRITNFPTFSDIKSASKIEKPKRISRPKPKNPNELEERLSTRLSAMQRRPTPSTLERPQSYFQQNKEEEQQPNIRKF